jgi:sugar phosphate isomerase/epimerase
MLRVGLNPYGLTSSVGLQTRDAHGPTGDATGLAVFLGFAREMPAAVVEIDWRWLVGLPANECEVLSRNLADAGQTAIVSAWLSQTAGESLMAALDAAVRLRAPLVRLHLTPVLEGGRSRLGSRWHEMVTHARSVLVTEAARARGLGLELGIENHQDFGSEELLAIAEEAGPNVGLVFDTGNPLAVGEDPIAFARRVRGRVRHLHLKDYRAQFTPDGYRLVRCAVGDGCVPLSEILDIVTPTDGVITASLEPAALEARHIRVFTPEWWQGYGDRSAEELSTMLERLQGRRIPDDADARTPWERGAPMVEVAAYERTHFDESLGHLRALGILTPDAKG